MFLNSPKIFYRPFIDLRANEVTTQEIDFYTDASRSSTKGFGCIFGTEWTFGLWEPGFIDQCQPSITYLELFALCVGIFTWQHKLTNCRIIVHCDNQGVRDIVNDLMSGCKNSMYLVRLLMLNNLLYNQSIRDLC